MKLRIRIKDMIRVRLRSNFAELKIGPLYLYLAKHAMRTAQFEAKERKKRRRKLRGMALDRAGHRCEICGREIDWRSVSIHHIQPRLHYPELEFDEDNLQALCVDCHRRLHYFERMEAMGLMPSHI